MADPVKVDFFPGDYQRLAADGGPLLHRNRFYELNPTLNDPEGVSFLPRPGLRYLTTVGEGPIRALFTEEGSFDGNLFVASYDSLFRLDSALTQTLLYSDLFQPEGGTVNMTVTAPIANEVPEYLFFADGRNLFVYTSNGYAHGTVSGSPANGDVIRTDTVYYQFTNASVDAGAPAGTLANPWLVALGINDAAAWANFAAALNASGDAGVAYSTALDANPVVNSVGQGATSVVVEARAPGAGGNAIITTETGAGIAWTGGTLSGGGDPYVRVVEMPDDIGAVDVATLDSYVFVLPVQDGMYRGRVYYIEPGENTVNPLNFFTAERSPDAVNGLEILGDMLWLPGDGSTEAWYVSQDPNARMQQLQGVVFDRGTWEGTATAIHESLIVVGADGAVFKITGGSPQRLSNPGIEQTIRDAIQIQRHLG